MTSRSATRSMFVCHIVTYRTEPPCIVPLLKSLCPASPLLKLSSYCSVPGVSRTPHLAYNTAREKHRSVTAEDAAEAVVDAERAMKAQQPRFYGGPLKPTLLNPLQQHTSRTNKTLGWFMADDIFEKKTNSSMVKSSDVKSQTVHLTKASEDKKRRRGTRRGKKNEYVPGQALSEGSAASEDLEEKQRVVGVGEPVREDYWYYDVASDGYYYEQNGAKGWRRRMPNSAMQRIKEQEMAQLAANNGKLPMMSPQAAAQAHALLQSALFSQPSLKYYDPNSDGFFYEMASVDGWKRRQPNKPLSASLSNAVSRPSPTPSYGAALARGQLPRNCVIDDSSASSSVSEDTAIQDIFGLDSAFSGISMGSDSPFRSSIISRPDSLPLSQQILPGFNADKFIQDLSFSGMDPNKVLGSVSRTPADAWSARCGGWNLPSMERPAPFAEDDSMGQLLKDLEKIWATPTPVGGLNA